MGKLFCEREDEIIECGRAAGKTYEVIAAELRAAGFCRSPKSISEHVKNSSDDVSLDGHRGDRKASIESCDKLLAALQAHFPGRYDGVSGESTTSAARVVRVVNAPDLRSSMDF